MPNRQFALRTVIAHSALTLYWEIVFRKAFPQSRETAGKAPKTHMKSAFPAFSNAHRHRRRTAEAEGFQRLEML
jgi:hypothetical protein